MIFNYIKCLYNWMLYWLVPVSSTTSLENNFEPRPVSWSGKCIPCASCTYQMIEPVHFGVPSPDFFNGSPKPWDPWVSIPKWSRFGWLGVSPFEEIPRLQTMTGTPWSGITRLGRAQCNPQRPCQPSAPGATPVMVFPRAAAAHLPLFPGDVHTKSSRNCRNVIKKSMFPQTFWRPGFHNDYIGKVEIWIPTTKNRGKDCIRMNIWRFPEMGAPESSILIGFSINKPSILGSPIYGNRPYLIRRWPGCRHKAEGRNVPARDPKTVLQGTWKLMIIKYW